MNNIVTFNTTINYNTPAVLAWQKVTSEISRDVTLSSREIAELTDKRHDNVKRDIRNMLKEIGVLNFEETSYFDRQGKEQREYHLPQRELFILLAGYNIKLRTRIIDRWLELEKQSKSPERLRNNPVYLQATTDAQADIITQSCAIIDEHLHNLTVDEWRSLIHQYMSRPDKGRLGQRAAKLCRARGIEIGKQLRTIRFRNGESEDKPVNVYPKHILDEAAKQLGLLK